MDQGIIKNIHNIEPSTKEFFNQIKMISKSDVSKKILESDVKTLYDQILERDPKKLILEAATRSLNKAFIFVYKLEHKTNEVLTQKLLDPERKLLMNYKILGVKSVMEKIKEFLYDGFEITHEIDDEKNMGMIVVSWDEE